MSDGGGDQTASGSWQPDPTGRYKLRWLNDAGQWTSHVSSEDGAMSSDPYDAPDASGAWQPDPTGRSRLRWQHSTGEWTNHVYSSEGALGSDPYDAPSERLAEQHPPQVPPDPPSELPLAEQLERFHASDTSPRTHSCYKCGHTDFVYKRDRALWHVCFWIGPFALFLTWIALPFLPKKPYCAHCRARDHQPTGGAKEPRKSGRKKLLIAIGVIVALFVVLGIVGSLIAPDSDTTAGKSPPSTTTAQTEPTTTTTTRRAVTTTRQPSVSADLCQAEAEAMAYLMGEVELLVAQLEFEFGVGDQEAAQDTYDTIDWAMDGLPSTASRIINDCRDYIPRSAAEDAQEAVNAMSAAWRQTKTVCRADLTPLGFDC